MQQIHSRGKQVADIVLTRRQVECLSKHQIPDKLECSSLLVCNRSYSHSCTVSRTDRVLNKKRYHVVVLKSNETN